MKQIQKLKTLLIIGTLGVTLVGCNQVKSKVPEETTSTAPVVTTTVSDKNIYNNSYEKYNNVTDLGVIINSPSEEELSQFSALEYFEYDKDTNEKMLVIPKYNGTKITVSSVDYNGERYITKDVLYSVDATPEGYGLVIKANRPDGVVKIAIDLIYDGKSVERLIGENESKGDRKDYEYMKVEAEGEKDAEGDLITPRLDADTYLEGLNRFDSYNVDMDKDGNDETLEVYCQAKVDNQGNYMLDDGNEWTLILRKGDKIYPLFNKSFIQLGGLEYTIYEDSDDYDRIHIMVAYNTGAAIMYNDCTYDEESGLILRSSLFEANNINKISEWTYKNRV